jgi:predicted dehydrogenase
MKNNSGDIERFFSVELRSKADLKNITMTNGARDGVLVEGTIGELVEASYAEGLILEIVGTKGTLRINLKDDEIRRARGTSPERNGNLHGCDA